MTAKRDVSKRARPRERSVFEVGEQESAAKGAFHPLSLCSLVGQNAEPGTYFLNRLPDALGVGPGYWGWMTIHRSADYAFFPSLVRGFGAQAGKTMTSNEAFEEARP
jgi:hypothetical protein